MDISHLRREYTRARLDEADVDRDPIRQFQLWFAQALEADVAEPNAMVLATSTCDGVPSARVVLLKGIEERGLLFFTDYSSRKGRELAENPQGALVFFWRELERQVRLEGAVAKLTRLESATYFHSRPRGSQLAASASLQSSVVAGRQQLETSYAQLEDECRGSEVPIPERWGGYCLTPRRVEFWQGRPNRLHDRIQYTRSPDGLWSVCRLSP